MKKRKVLKVALLVAVVGLILWRLVPRPFSHFLPEGETVSRLDCTALVLGGTWGLDPDTGTHTLHGLTPEDKAFAQIAGLLGSTGYRPDLRNLLPWESNTGGMVDDRTVRVVFTWGTDPARTCEMSLNRGDKVVVRWWSGDGTDRVGRPQFYHPTDRSVKDALVDYLIARGEFQEPGSS